MSLRALSRVILCLLMCMSWGVYGLKLEPREGNLTISDIPPCGITCLLLTVPSTGCGFSDVDCQCKSDDLAHSLSACMLANCTMADILEAAKVQDDLCGLSEESKSRQVYIYTGTCYAIALLFVTLRLLGKITTKRLALDDWIVLTALLLTAVPLGIVLKMAGIGFGEHLWNLQPGELMRDLRFFYVAWSTYTIVLGLIKVSLIIFYLEIFPTKRFRIVSTVILAYIVINTMVIFFLTIFNCSPVRAFWDRDIKGKCMDINALAYANSASAIVQDVILLVLPLACIRKLNMKRYRKIAVGFMFSIGTFGCITTIIRLHSLLLFKTTIDPTWDYVPITIWTELELASGFVCVSLPAIRLLLVRILPRNFISSITSKSRNTPTPRPEMRKPEKKGFSWMHISTDNYNSSVDSSKGSRLWPGTSHSRSQSHQRLGSDHGEHSADLMPVGASNPPAARCSVTSDEQLEMLAVPKTRQKEKCKSCGSEGSYMTALPRIGCLPDESFSKEDVQKASSEGRWWDIV